MSADYPNKMKSPPKGKAEQRGHTGPVVDSNVEGKQHPPITVRKTKTNKSNSANMVGNTSTSTA